MQTVVVVPVVPLPIDAAAVAEAWPDVWPIIAGGVVFGVLAWTTVGMLRLVWGGRRDR